MRLYIENSKNLENIVELKNKKRDDIQKAIKREKEQINKREIGNATDEIIHSKHVYQFFKVIKYVCNPQIMNTFLNSLYKYVEENKPL